MIEYNILKIIPDTAVDGEGLRTSIYFAGCSVHCPGCHNPESWDFNKGTRMNIEEIINACEESGHKKVTLTGGNPIEQDGLVLLCSQLKQKGYNIWLYTGWKFEEIHYIDWLEESSNYDILNFLDVIVDGPFIENLYDENLKYRGSTNQKIWRNNDGKWIAD